VFPNAKARVGHVLESVAASKGVLAFDLQVEPNMKGHLVGPGTYRLRLIVAAANALPVEYEIEMIFTGDWYDDEDKMLTDGFQMKTIAGPISAPSFLQKLQKRFEEIDLHT
jgi:hypothetical protein